MIGQTLSHYRITAALGAGGMGEVYRATDASLGREVAIKVLPPEVAQDEERLARFRREAQLLASLNHPNIAAIYGLEEAEGKPFLALELVEGETLRERLDRGAIPVDEALEIATQTAEALEEAHEKGIVHRDLKPANVKLTPEGKVKILDFGLAKAYAGVAASGSSPDLSQSPTLAHSGTAAGLILGTAGYMSPEQARGKPVDKRADIWAFGVLLWEMITGRQLFTGETVSDVLAAVLTREPDGSQLPGKARHLGPVLRRCLERDPRRRFRDIGDVRMEIARARQAAREPEPATATTAGRRRAAAYALFALAGALVSGVAVWVVQRPPPATVKRFSIQLPPIDYLIRGPGSPVVLSPDGTRLVCLGMRDRLTQLYLRRLDALEATPLEHTEGALHPFFSPDGAWLGFYARGALHKLSFDGGLPVKIADLPGGVVGPPGAASWGDDGFVYYVPSPASAILRVAADGGTPEPVTQLDEEAGERGHYWPEALPGGRGLLFTVWSGRIQSAQVAGQVLGAQRHVVLAPGTQPRMAGPDHVVFCQGNTLHAAPLDTDAMALRGPTLPVVEAVEVNPSGAVQYSISRRGTLVYVAGQGSAFEGRLAWVDRDGSVIGDALTGIASDTQSFRLSPDGRRVVVSFGSPLEMWVYSLSGQPPIPLAPGMPASSPVWDPTGRDIAFQSPTPDFVYRVHSDGSSAEPRLVLAGVNAGPWDWTPDGREILLHASRPGGVDILAVAAEGGEPREVVATEHDEWHPALSPDGRWLAYVSDLTGRPEVWVRPWDAPGAPLRLSKDGGVEPQWGPDGRELYFRELGPALLSVTVIGQDPPAFDGPRMLFSSPFVFESSPSYAVAEDGRFLMSANAARLGASEAVVVLDWLSEVERRLSGR